MREDRESEVPRQLSAALVTDGRHVGSAEETRRQRDRRGRTGSTFRTFERKDAATRAEFELLYGKA
jgi:hypothetical protein